MSANPAFNRQFRAAAANYDNQSPPEPDYGLDDADGDIAAELVKADEVAELVLEVRESAGLLDWIAHNVELPANLLTEFRILDRRAKRLSDRASELCEVRS